MSSPPDKNVRLKNAEKSSSQGKILSSERNGHSGDSIERVKKKDSRHSANGRQDVRGGKTFFEELNSPKDDFYLSAAKKIMTTLVKNRMNGKQPRLSDWAKQGELMEKKDKIPRQEILRVIEVNDKNFGKLYFPEILSFGALREKYTQIIAYENRTANKVNEKKYSNKHNDPI